MARLKVTMNFYVFEIPCIRVLRFATVCNPYAISPCLCPKSMLPTWCFAFAHIFAIRVGCHVLRRCSKQTKRHMTTRVQKGVPGYHCRSLWAEGPLVTLSPFGRHYHSQPHSEGVSHPAPPKKKSLRPHQFESTLGKLPRPFGCVLELWALCFTSFSFWDAPTRWVLRRYVHLREKEDAWGTLVGCGGASDFLEQNVKRRDSWAHCCPQG